MPKRKSTPADYLARDRVKSSKVDKDIVNSEELKRDLDPRTKQAYTRSLALWNQYGQSADVIMS